MKKKYLLFLFVILSFAFIQIMVVFCRENNIDLLSLADRISKIDHSIDTEYPIKASSSLLQSSEEENVKNMSEKITYLLLGNPNEKVSDYKEYAYRKKELLSLRYNKEIPKDKNGSLQEDSEEYQDDIVTGYNIPNMFLTITEKNITYTEKPITEIFETEKYIISRNVFRNITMETESANNPKEFTEKNTNLILYYFFKELNNQPKLYWIMAETEDNLNTYFQTTEQLEYANKINVVNKYDGKIDDLYDTTKLAKISESMMKTNYLNSVKNVVNVNAISNQNIASSAMGFFLSDGIVATSWSFFQNAMQYAEITITDQSLKSYEIDGIVTANDALDIVLIKLKNKTNTSIKLPGQSTLKEEDGVMLLGSKSGLNISPTTGIVISSSGTIKAMIPTSPKEVGSPLFDMNGVLVGYLQPKSYTSSISTFIPSIYLKEIKEQIEKVGFNNLKIISLESLKEKYNVTYKEEQIKNTIPEKVWNEYKTIGKIESNISLTLKKASYYNNIVSLRYSNNTSSYFENEENGIDLFLLAMPFVTELENSGYKETYSSSSKRTYENEKYEIILMKEFNYLIVLMMRK